MLSPTVYILVIATVMLLIAGWIIAQEKRDNQIRSNPADESGLWGVIQIERPYQRIQRMRKIQRELKDAQVPTVQG